jgi:hypothetical protein
VKPVRTSEELDSTLRRQISILKDQYLYSNIITNHLDIIEDMRPYAIFDVSLFPAIYKGIPVINFTYCGCAKDEEEARADLADIMRINRVIFDDVSYVYDTTFHEHGYAGEYRGNGKWGDKPVEIKLVVPWLPTGCKIEWTIPEEPFRKVENRPQASLICENG